MDTQDISRGERTVDASVTSADEDLQAQWRRVVGRRSFLKGVGLAGAAALPGERAARRSRVCAERAR